MNTSFFLKPKAQRSSEDLDIDDACLNACLFPEVCIEALILGTERDFLKVGVLGPEFRPAESPARSPDNGVSEFSRASFSEGVRSPIEKSELSLQRPGMT
ncbi:hypothetical protein P8452_36226 [Trifolium repens]|nr:hypothetical protein P8452_36226 [Trifolium repens]